MVDYMVVLGSKDIIMDFTAAFNDPTNHKCMKYACIKYHRILDIEERKECQLIGLWLATQTWDETKSSFAHWVIVNVRWFCGKVWKRKKRYYSRFESLNGAECEYDDAPLFDEPLLIDTILCGYSWKELQDKYGISKTTLSRRLNKCYANWR